MAAAAAAPLLWLAINEENPSQEREETPPHGDPGGEGIERQEDLREGASCPPRQNNNNDNKNTGRWVTSRLSIGVQDAFDVSTWRC